MQDDHFVDPADDALSAVFSSRFRLGLVAGAERQRIYRLRYRVFCEELGYGMRHQHGYESDDYDDSAIHCLLHYRTGGVDVGSARLVLPPADGRGLPFQYFGLPHVDRRLFDWRQVDPGACCEVSRLAVIPDFRRPVMMPGQTGRGLRFPFGVVSLYYGLMALILRHGYAWSFMVGEPRLQRHMARWGICWRQISPPFEHFGSRAVFMSTREELARDAERLPRAWRQLYDSVCEQLFETGTGTTGAVSSGRASSR